MKTLLAAILATIIITLFILSYPLLFVIDVLLIHSAYMNYVYDGIAFNIVFYSRIDALLDAIHQETQA